MLDRVQRPVGNGNGACGVAMPTFFIPHGGGPCFSMDPPPPFARSTWDGLAAYLRGISHSFPRPPRAVLVISAHWEETEVTVNAASRHKLFYDYFGFPPHTYQLEYPAVGDPALAYEVHTALNAAGTTARSLTDRGLDHGVFVPFMLVYPSADVPIVQLSLKEGMDAAGYIALGGTLRPLREQGVLIIGSGMSYHNIEAMISRTADAGSRQFDAWLRRAVLDTANRESLLANWKSAPAALEAHPSDDHLMPLMVVAGSAIGASATIDFSQEIAGKAVSGIRFD